MYSQLHHSGYTCFFRKSKEFRNLVQYVQKGQYFVDLNWMLFLQEVHKFMYMCLPICSYLIAFSSMLSDRHPVAWCAYQFRQQHFLIRSQHRRPSFKKRNAVRSFIISIIHQLELYHGKHYLLKLFGKIPAANFCKM